jgi:hypothetical protein
VSGDGPGHKPAIDFMDIFQYIAMDLSMPCAIKAAWEVRDDEDRLGATELTNIS